MTELAKWLLGIVLAGFLISACFVKCQDALDHMPEPPPRATVSGLR